MSARGLADNLKQIAGEEREEDPKHLHFSNRNTIFKKKNFMGRTRSALDGISGIVGPVIFKQYRDKTVVTSRPSFPKKKKRTKNQKENSSLFKYAVAYAQSIIRDPKKKS